MKSINEIIGANVRRLRKEREYTQEELADRAGLHVTFIAHIESGKKICSVKSLTRLANALNVKPEVLLLPEESKTYKIELDKRTKSLVSVVRDLPDSKKDLVISLAKAVAGRGK
jgi:transcriptional regulator with XRE-family HTH domain